MYQRGRYYAKTDASKFFYHIPIAVEARKYFCGVFGDRVVRYTRLPPASVNAWVSKPIRGAVEVSLSRLAIANRSAAHAGILACPDPAAVAWPVAFARRTRSPGTSLALCYESEHHIKSSMMLHHMLVL